MTFSLSRVVTFIIGLIVSIIGLYFLSSHIGVNWETLVSVFVIIIGVWIMLDRTPTITT